MSNTRRSSEETFFKVKCTATGPATSCCVGLQGENASSTRSCSAWMSGTDADRAAASGEPASSSARATSCCSRSGSISPFQARLDVLRVPPAMWRASTASIMRSWKGPTACGTAGSKGPVWVLLSWYAGVCPLPDGEPRSHVLTAAILLLFRCMASLNAWEPFASWLSISRRECSWRWATRDSSCGPSSNPSWRASCACTTRSCSHST
mmetsp:Transcript_17790/g.53600  ORF Transcript_17790/g.53600 Transcript_17790/m.53600 type:complete len:208 (-) Transcript_17790:959-1582(-)